MGRMGQITGWKLVLPKLEIGLYLGYLSFNEWDYHGQLSSVFVE